MSQKIRTFISLKKIYMLTDLYFIIPHIVAEAQRNLKSSNAKNSVLTYLFIDDTYTITGNWEMVG